MTFSVLVPIEQSEMGEAGIDVAVKFANQLRAKVYLLCVYPPVRGATDHAPSHVQASETRVVFYEGVNIATVPSMRGVETDTQASERRAAECVDYLTPLSKRFEGLEVSCMVREGADTAKEIIECAQEQQVDLIIMPTHGRSGVAHMLFGSVAEAVVRAGVVPVLVHRP